MAEQHLIIRPAPLDEQRLRARVAALDAAVHMVTGGGRNLVNNDEFVTDTAAAFEDWLMRPAPVDAECPNAEYVNRPVTGERCDTFWRNIDGQLHRCQYGPGHAPGCRCSCGSTPDTG